MTFLKNKSTRALIFIMCALVLMGITFSHFYYKNLNNSVDARIVEARKLYEQYNGYAQANNFDSLFYLMDTIEAIYNSVPYYSGSYEIGVLYNNRSAAYLTIAVFNQEMDRLTKDSVLQLAQQNSLKSISIYQDWINSHKGLVTSDEIKKSISEKFSIGLENYDDQDKIKFLKNRVKEIEVAQAETPRRLSVSYTNLGLVYRHREDYDTAAGYYKKAIGLWDQNLTAENNLNIILGKPLKKRTLIQKLFPPDKD